MLRVVEKILFLVPFNGGFSRMELHASVTILILKMVTRSSILLTLLTLLTCDFAQNMRQHLSPPGPVMIDIRPPQIQRVRNSLPFQNV